MAVLGLMPSCTVLAPEDGPDELTLVHMLPERNAISTQGRLDVCLSNLVDPRSVPASGATFSSGERSVAADVTVQLVPYRPAPGETLGEEPWCEGSVLSLLSTEALALGVNWRVQLTATIHGWRGETLALGEPWRVAEDGNVLEFRPHDAAWAPSPSTSLPTLRSLFDAGNVLAPKTGACTCHQMPGEPAWTLLPMHAPLPMLDALLRSGRLRDTGFPMLTPGEPSESFFLQKVLRQDGNALPGILGDAMPPTHALPFADYVALARWIEAGALP